MAQFHALFVCMGNICRSPAGEAVFRSLVDQEGLSDQIACDSAGTIDYHAGSSPDPRMIHAGRQRGIKVAGMARQVKKEDLERFDLMLAMDEANFRYLLELAPSAEAKRKIHRFCDYVESIPAKEVPDPYYGNDDGFEKVFEILEDGCANLLVSIRDRLAER